MLKKRLGHSEIEISAIGLGCMGMSMSYGVRNDPQSIETIHQALDIGVNFLDSSDMYGAGKNEELLGIAIKERRADVVMATKFGNVRNPDGTGGVNGRPEYVVEACHASLKRLQIDVIDLYYQHRVDPKVPIEETIGAMKTLVEAGKVRAIGLSEAGPDTIRRAHAVHPISALQTEYSLWSRGSETELLPLCRELGITYVAYSPLGRGFLSGTIRKPDDLIDEDRRHDHPRFHPENLAKNAALLEVLDALAETKGCTAAQIALAWVFARQSQLGNDIIPIPGTKRVSYLDANVAALDVPLSTDEVARLTAAFPPDAAAGTRYPEKQLGGLGI